LTDLEYALDNLERNINKTLLVAPTDCEEDCHIKFSNLKAVKARFLDWSDPSTYFFPSIDENEPVTSFNNQSCEWDVILGADIVWLEELVPSLLQALDALASPRTVVYLAHQVHVDML
jgi:hypothetical protein